MNTGGLSSCIIRNIFQYSSQYLERNTKRDSFILKGDDSHAGIYTTYFSSSQTHDGYKEICKSQSFAVVIRIM